LDFLLSTQNEKPAPPVEGDTGSLPLNVDLLLAPTAQYQQTTGNQSDCGSGGISVNFRYRLESRKRETGCAE